MAYTPSMNRLILPDIKNASALYLAIYGMAEGDIIDVNRTDLPPFYNTITTLINRVSRKYKQYYEIRKLVNPDGWRIIKLNSLENLDKINIFKSKLNHVCFW